jgi:hypothetical protein
MDSQLLPALPQRGNLLTVTALRWSMSTSGSFLSCQRRLVAQRDAGPNRARPGANFLPPLPMRALHKQPVQF